MTEPSPDAIPTPEPETVAPAETCEMSPETAPTAENAAAPASTDPVAVLTAEVDKWKDLAYRSQAELDNFRKRSAREAQETRAYANADLLRGILPIIDNFEMGLEAARAESEKSMIFMGMSMVQRQIADFLRDMGVTEVEAGPGKAFDPHLHDAVSTEASEAHPEGSILRVSRRGFKLKDRLLRPASVIVVGAANQESKN